MFSDFVRELGAAHSSLEGEDPKQRMATLIRTYIHYVKDQPALHKVMVQEASYPNPRLDWLIEEHLKPLFDATFKMIAELQDAGVAAHGNPALLFNMIRLASGGLMALGNELKESSGIDIDDPATLDELADMIVRVFLPGEPRPTQDAGAAA